MILSPEIISLYILNVLFVFFASIAFYHSVKITLFYDANSTSTLQYTLEKGSYLAATIIKYILSVKIPLFIFFIFTLDKLSNVVNGAMCAAGIVNATDYGTKLLMLKVLNLYLFAYWIVLHNEDTKDESAPYTKQKFALFIVIYILLMIEIVFEIMMFSAIDTTTLVDCCGVIYSATSGSYIGSLVNSSTPLLLSLFYGIFFLLSLLFFIKQKYLYALSNLFFLIISIITLIAFFGTYIYELPTHKCPFCFLQKDYYYIGYILYILLFVGTFHGITLAFVPFSKKKLEQFYTLSMFFNSAYVFLVSVYPLHYYIKNGVWL